MPTRLSLGSLSLILDLTIKKGVCLPCINWSGAGTALLMSLRQNETSQYEAICVTCQAGSQFNGYINANIYIYIYIYIMLPILSLHQLVKHTFCSTNLAALINTLFTQMQILGRWIMQ